MPNNHDQQNIYVKTEWNLKINRNIIACGIRIIEVSGTRDSVSLVGYDWITGLLVVMREGGFLIIFLRFHYVKL